MRNPIRDIIMWHPYPEEKPPDHATFCVIIWDGELHPASWWKDCQRFHDMYGKYMFEDNKVSWWTQVLMPSNIDTHIEEATVTVSMQCFAMALNVEP